jgi:hypothetical protein
MGKAAGECALKASRKLGVKAHATFSWSLGRRIYVHGGNARPV